MKKILRIILFLSVSALSIPFLSAVGKPRITIETTNVYLRELINFEIVLPDTEEKDDLDIRVEVTKGKGVVTESRIFYSVSFDVVEDESEYLATNDIGFVPLEIGELSLKAVVEDKGNPGIILQSEEHIINIIPRPADFDKHKPFIHASLKDKYYIGEEILICYELFFSDGVEITSNITPDFKELPVKFLKLPKVKTVYFSREETTVRPLLTAVIQGKSAGVVTLPAQSIQTTSGETITSDNVKFEILPIPSSDLISEENQYLVGANINVDFVDLPEKLKRGAPCSFKVVLTGGTNLRSIKSLKRFLNTPDSLTESLIESTSEVNSNEIINKLVFKYEGQWKSFLKPGIIRFKAPFFNTTEHSWETITEESHEISYSMNFIPFFILLVILIVFVVWKTESYKLIYTRLTKTKSVEASQENGTMPELDCFFMLYSLTPKEKEITSLLINGKGTKDIASQLYISPETVRKHIRNIMKKTDTHSRYEIHVLFTNLRNKK